MRFDLSRVKADEFWSRANKLGACWLWTGFLDGKGYGRFTIARGIAGAYSEGAHRVSWALTNGAIPTGVHVLHNCDNPWCVNPAHLRLGTHAENMADMATRGRARGGSKPGEACGHAKLSWDTVREIRRLWALPSHPSQRALGERFGVDRATISYVVRGKTWPDGVAFSDPESTTTRATAGEGSGSNSAVGVGG